MKKEIVKKGFDEAQNSLREKQVEEVKKIVLKTLEKIDTLKGNKKKKQAEVKEIDEQIKILESDIEDLKVGRIDRIVERQEKDEKAREVSVVVIIKEKEIIREPWFQPYVVVEKWNHQPYIDPNIVWCGSTNNGNSALYSNTINCSVAKFGTIGTYDVNGTIVNLR